MNYRYGPGSFGYTAQNQANNAGNFSGASGFEVPAEPEPQAYPATPGVQIPGAAAAALAVPGYGVSYGTVSEWTGPQASEDSLRRILTQDPYNPIVPDATPFMHYTTMPPGTSRTVQNEINYGWKLAPSSEKRNGDDLYGIADDKTRAFVSKKQSRLLRNNYGISGNRHDDLFNQSLEGSTDKAFVGVMVDPQTGEAYDVYENKAFEPVGDFLPDAGEHRRHFDRLVGGWRSWADPRGPKGDIVETPQDWGPEEIFPHGDPDTWVRRRQKEWAAMDAFHAGRADSQDFGEADHVQEYATAGRSGPIPRRFPAPPMHLHRGKDAIRDIGRGYQDIEIGRMDEKPSFIVRRKDMLVNAETGNNLGGDDFASAPDLRDTELRHVLSHRDDMHLAMGKALMAVFEDMPDLRDGKVMRVARRNDVQVKSLGKWIAELAMDIEVPQDRSEVEKRAPLRNDALVRAVGSVLADLPETIGERDPLLTDRRTRDAMVLAMGRAMVALSESGWTRMEKGHMEAPRNNRAHNQVQRFMTRLYEVDAGLAMKVLDLSETVVREVLATRGDQQPNRRFNFDKTSWGEDNAVRMEMEAMPDWFDGIMQKDRETSRVGMRQMMGGSDEDEIVGLFAALETDRDMMEDREMINARQDFADPDLLPFRTFGQSGRRTPHEF